MRCVYRYDYKFDPKPRVRPLDIGLLRPDWVQLKRLRTRAGRFHSTMNKSRLAPTSICKCGALDRNAAHVILECSLHCASRGYHGYKYLPLEIEE